MNVQGHLLVPGMSFQPSLVFASKAGTYPSAMFVERHASYSALFTFLVGWHASAVSFPPGDVILARRFTLRVTHLYLYKHYRMKYLQGAPLWGRLLALPTNIILDWRGLPETFTLAYYNHS